MKNIFNIIFALVLISSCTKKKSDNPSPIPLGGTGTTQQYQSTLYYQETVGDAIQYDLSKGKPLDSLVFGMKVLISTKGDSMLIGVSWDANDNGAGQWFFDTLSATSSVNTLPWGNALPDSSWYAYGPGYINGCVITKNYAPDSLDYIHLKVARYDGGDKYPGTYGTLINQQFTLKKQPKAYHQCATYVIGMQATAGSSLYKVAVQLGKLFDDK